MYLVLYICLLLITIRFETISPQIRNDLCESTKGEFKVYQTLRVDDRILLVIKYSNNIKGFFGVKGFNYYEDDRSITFESIEELKSLPQWLKSDKTFLLFTLTNNSVKTPIAITYAMPTLTDKEYLLIAYQFDLNTNFEVFNVKNYTIDIYFGGKMENNDPWALKKLFMKFPEDEPSERFHSILSIPMKEGLEGLLNQYILVFYSEKEPKKKKTSSQGKKTRFKRFLLRLGHKNNDIWGKNVWEYDPHSYDCINETTITDATIPLDTKLRRVESEGSDGPKYVFDFIKFSSKKYTFKGVQIAENIVYKDLINYTETTGNISKLFCDTTRKPRKSTPFISTEIKTKSTRKPKTSEPITRFCITTQKSGALIVSVKSYFVSITAFISIFLVL